MSQIEGRKGWVSARDPIRSIVLLIAFSVASIVAVGQSFNMANGALFESCTGFFYDSGGPSTNYSNDEDLTATICPVGGAGSGPATKVTFAAWNVQAGSADKLFIYDGATTSGTLLATGQGSISLLGQTFTSSDPSGCLTFRWTSSPSGVAPGWRADILTAGNPGTNASITKCSTDPSFNMFAQLGGTPDPGGQWTNPSGVNHSPVFNPSVDVSGIYTYTTAPTAPCNGATATLTVTVIPAADPGTNGTVTFCSSDAPTSLFPSLGGAPQSGGTWTRPAGTPFSGTFDPAVNPPGVYTYTVQGTPPCGPASATVTVSVNAAPFPGGDATTTVCSTDAPFALISRLTGTPDPGGSWTGPNGMPMSGTFMPGTNVAGNYKYTVTGSPPCTPRFAFVTVILQQAPDPGINTSITICSNEPAFSMRGRMNGTPSTLGSWTGPNAQSHSDTFNPVVDPAGVYTYTVPGMPPCTPRSATLTISVNQAPNAGANGTVAACSTDGNFPLSGHLGGSPDPNGTWSNPSGTSHSGNFDPGVDAPGVYMYTVTGVAPCANVIATVTVSVNQAPNAGSNNSVSVCSSNASFALISRLGGTPNSGGSWTFNGSSHSATFNPASDVSGVYTYTVAGIAPCANAVATVTITVNQAPVAGTNSTLAICSNNASVQLFPLLGGTPDNTGSWTAPGGASHSGSLNPAVDVSGIYLYHVTGIAPCTTATASITATITQAPNAGSNGTITVCSNSASFLLFSSLGGNPNISGSWTRPNGTAHSGTFNPASDVGGVYTYSVNGSGPCTNATATVQVIRNIAARAGTDGTITLCSNSAQVTLLSILGGSPDATGTWTGPNGLPYNSPSFNPSTGSSGTYTYIVPGTSPCVSDTAFATINVNSAPVAGTNGSTQVCETAAPFFLISRLGGNPSPGGLWTNPVGTVHGATFNPGTHMPGVYTYSVMGNPPCAPATATVLVSVSDQPYAGSSGSATVCSTAPAFNLISSLGGNPDQGGSWNAPGGASHSGVFTPGNSTPGAYTYTIAVSAGSPCTTAVSTVNVTVNAAPNSGAPGGLSVCNDAGNIDLFAVLNGAPNGGGTWNDDDNSGGLLPGGILDPTGLSTNDYDFTYTVVGIGNCPASSTTVTITIVNNLNAGSNSTKTICGNDPAYDLYNALNGNPQPGGNWTDTDNTNALFGGFFNSTLVNAGTYHFTYTLSGTAGCAPDMAVLTVIVRAPANAGTNGSRTVCSNGASFNMFNELGGNPQTGGTWRDPSNASHSNMYNPAVDVPGVYTYRVSGTSPCPLVTATVTVTEVQAPDAGDNTTITVCETDGALNMLLALSGTPQNTGVWTNPNNQPHPGNSFQPGVDLEGLYIYTVAGGQYCSDDIAALSINVNDAPNAGQDAAITVCSSDGQFLLITAISGNPSTNGTWKNPSGAAHNGVFIPGSSMPGDYMYTVPGTAPCIADVSTVSVFVNQAANAGLNANFAVCSNGGAVQLLAHLGGSPSNSGSWFKPNNTPHSGTLIPSTDPDGTYTYVVQGIAPCPNATSSLVVTISSAPSAGSNTTIIICSSQAAFAMVSQLNGTPDLNGIWRNSTGVQMNGIFIPGTTPPGTYSYTVAGSGSCQPAVSNLTIVQNAAVNAGNDGSVTFCSTSGAQPLFPYLGAGAQTGGSWFRPNGQAHSGTYLPASQLAGIYQYIRYGTAPCPNDTAKITVNVSAAPYAGGNGVTTICDDVAPFSLHGILSGMPSTSGNWFAPNMSAHSNIFNPSSDVQGVYTYVINGGAFCSNDTAYATVIKHHQPNAGNNNTIAICSNDAPFALINQLGGNPDPGGTWTNPNNIPFNGTYTPGNSTPGLYRYSLSATAPCVPDQATVMVNQSQAANAGINSVATICTDQPPFQLLTLLNGNPNTNGTWVGPNAMAHLGLFMPATDSSGIYTYTVPGIPPCTSATSTVQITKVPAPNAGDNGNLTVCDDDDSVVLFDGLQGSPASGGSWTDLDATGQLTGGLFDASGVGIGVYRFKYQKPGVGPCPLDSAVVTVTVTNMLNAGTDNMVQVCKNEDAFVLIDQLGGSPQQGGMWIDVDMTGALTNGVLDATAVAALGTYHFTYILPQSASCLPDTAMLTVVIVDGPNAGVNGFSNLCSTASPLQMIILLGGGPDAGGTWVDPVFLTHSGTFDPLVDPPGFYTYVVEGVGGCTNDSATVEIQVTPSPDAGLGGNLSVCDSDVPFSLFAQLGGTPDSTGSWTGPGSVPHSDIFNPNADVTGPYQYRVPGNGPCAAVLSTLNVVVNEAPQAGNNGTHSVCTNEAPFMMFNFLGGTPDQGGSWFLPIIGPHGPMFNPAVDPAGAYQYVVSGSAPCQNDTSLLVVNLLPSPDPGIGGTLDTCGGTTSLDLFTGLSGTPDLNGIWYDLDNTGALSGSILDISGLAFTTYDFMYVVPATAQCDSAFAMLTVNLAAGGAFPGISDSVMVCGADTAFNLFTVLAGPPDIGGTWSDVDSSGALSLWFVDLQMLTQGLTYEFVYTLSGSGPCDSASASIWLTPRSYPDPGQSAGVFLCISSDSIQLFDQLGGTPDPGGTWTGPGGLPSDRFFHPGSEQEGLYTYTVQGDSVCPDTAAFVNIVVNTEPFAGPDVDLRTCKGPFVVDVLGFLTGADTSGYWIDLDGSMALSGNSFYVDSADIGLYDFLYIATATGCPQDTSALTVSVIGEVEIGEILSECDERYRTYTVQIEILGGLPGTYTVDGLDGDITTDAGRYFFNSIVLLDSDEPTITINDAMQCGPIELDLVSPCSFENAVFVPESFSPDGDGINEILVILGIEEFPENEIHIYNRWGSIVYEEVGYDNETKAWDGTAQKAAIKGPLPDATYYYVLDLKNGEKPYTGFIYLNR